VVAAEQDRELQQLGPARLVRRCRSSRPAPRR
jgi:hypothetical protein